MHSKLLERLVFFSDAVFAIAITLLVVELSPPHLAYGPNQDARAWYALAEHIPGFIGFFVSFVVIGAFWALHHRAFGFVARHDSALVWPNLFLLGTIAFLPFSTAFMSSNSGQFVPHLFYLLSLLAAGLLQVRLIRLVLRPEYLAADADGEAVAAVRRRVWALPGAAALGVVLNLFSPTLSVIALVVATPLLVRLLARGH
jgi:uncharacterized membrane protein